MSCVLDHKVVVESLVLSSLLEELASTAKRKSKITHSKVRHSKVLWDGVFRDFKWLLYFRRGVLVIAGLFYSDCSLH